MAKTKFLESILNIKYDKALTDSKKYLILGEKAEKIALEINDSLQLAKAYKIKSLAYHFSSNLDASIKYTINAAKIFNQLKDYENYANSYTNLGWQIKNINLKKGIYYMNTGIKILENNAKNSLSLASAYNNYGVLKQREKQLDSALFYHTKSLKICLVSSVCFPTIFKVTLLKFFILSSLSKYSQNSKILSNPLCLFILPTTKKLKSFCLYFSKLFSSDGLS